MFDESPFSVHTEFSEIIPLKQNPIQALHVTFHLDRVSYAIRRARPEAHLRIGSEFCVSQHQSQSHPFVVPLLPLPVYPSVLPASSASAPRTSTFSWFFSEHWLNANTRIARKERRMMFF